MLRGFYPLTIKTPNVPSLLMTECTASSHDTTFSGVRVRNVLADDTLVEFIFEMLRVTCVAGIRINKVLLCQRKLVEVDGFYFTRIVSLKALSVN